MLVNNYMHYIASSGVPLMPKPQIVNSGDVHAGSHELEHDEATWKIEAFWTVVSNESGMMVSQIERIVW